MATAITTMTANEMLTKAAVLMNEGYAGLLNDFLEA
jgi:hypothetical protein